MRLKKTAAQDGRLLVDWGKVMYFLTWSCMVVIMRLLPLGVPTAQLNGSMFRENFFLKVWATWRAIRRRIAVGIPSGWSFVLLAGPLWRQNR